MLNDKSLKNTTKSTEFTENGIRNFIANLHQIRILVETMIVRERA